MVQIKKKYNNNVELSVESCGQDTKCIHLAQWSNECPQLDASHWENEE